MKLNFRFILNFDCVTHESDDDGEEFVHSAVNDHGFFMGDGKLQEEKRQWEETSPRTGVSFPKSGITVDTGLVISRSTARAFHAFPAFLSVAFSLSLSLDYYSPMPEDLVSSELFADFSVIPPRSRSVLAMSGEAGDAHGVSLPIPLQEMFSLLNPCTRRQTVKGVGAGCLWPSGFTLVALSRMGKRTYDRATEEKREEKNESERMGKWKSGDEEKDGKKHARWYFLRFWNKISSFLQFCIFSHATGIGFPLRNVVTCPVSSFLLFSTSLRSFHLFKPRRLSFTALGSGRKNFESILEQNLPVAFLLATLQLLTFILFQAIDRIPPWTWKSIVPKSLVKKIQIIFINIDNKRGSKFNKNNASSPSIRVKSYTYSVYNSTALRSLNRAKRFFPDSNGDVQKITFHCFSRSYTIVGDAKVHDPYGLSKIYRFRK